MPETAGKANVTILPAGSIQPASLEVACVRRPGGHVIELAIPFDAIADGFRATPGKTLYFEAVVNDKDLNDARGVLSNLALSGDDNASRRTTGYARLTFQP